MRRGRKGELRTAIEDGTAEDLVAVLRSRCAVQPEGLGCWIWQGAVSSGRPWIRGQLGRSQYAHRALWEKLHGPITGTMEVHHRCGVARCLRPDHLQLVRPQENAAEMLQRRALQTRIEDLEAALRSAVPEHPLLDTTPAITVLWGGAVDQRTAAERAARRAASRARYEAGVQRRYDQAREVDRLRAGGMTSRAACEQIGIHPSSYSRWSIRARG